MINQDPLAERAMLNVWEVLKLAERRGELWQVPLLRKARAEAARALCSSPRDARTAIRRAQTHVAQALALIPSATLAEAINRTYSVLGEAAR